jgi:SAM-dependent methyltransferase
MSRLDFQRAQAIGSVVNLGCGDDPASLGDRATHLDIDTWDLPNFVLGDVHNLPFDDGLFDTAILGDVLEHCANPERAVREAARVARRVVITVPEELALPSVGQHLALGLKQRADHYRNVHGWQDAPMSDEEVIVAHKRTDPRFVSAWPESEIPHDGHVNRFDEAWVRRLIEASGKKCTHFSKEPEGVPGESWHNWLVVLE